MAKMKNLGWVSGVKKREETPWPARVSKKTKEEGEKESPSQ